MSSFSFTSSNGISVDRATSVGRQRCSRCKETKLISKFWASPNTRNLRRRCNRCESEYQREYRKHTYDPEKRAADYRLRKEKIAITSAKSTARWRQEYIKKHGVEGYQMWLRNNRLRRNFGIEHADYERMLAEQGGACAICQTTEITGRGRYFSVDHCHKTNKIRGLLCNVCNNGLGQFRDNLETLEAAKKYLLENQ